MSSSIFATLGLDVTPFKQAFAQASEIARTNATKMRNSVAASGLGGQLAGAVSVGGIVMAASSFADMAVKVDAASKTAGVGREFMQGFAQAAEEAGFDMSKSAVALEKFSLARANALNGDKAALSIFKELGVSVRDATGASKGTQELLFDTADGLSKIADASQRARLGMALMGRSSAELIPVLSDPAFRSNVENSPVVSDESIQSILDARKAIKDVQDNVTVAGGSLAGGTSRFFKGFFGELTDAYYNGGGILASLARIPGAAIGGIGNALGGSAQPMDALFKSQTPGFKEQEAAADRLKNLRETASAMRELGMKGSLNDIALDPNGVVQKLTSMQADLRAQLDEAATDDEIKRLANSLGQVDKALGAALKTANQVRLSKFFKAEGLADEGFERALAAKEKETELEKKAADAARDRARSEADDRKAAAQDAAEIAKASSAMVGGRDVSASEQGSYLQEIAARNQARNDAIQAAQERAAERAKAAEEKAAEEARRQADEAAKADTDRTRAEYYGERLNDITARIATSGDVEEIKQLQARRDKLIDRIESVDPAGKYVQVSDAVRNAGEEELRRLSAAAVDVAREQLTQLRDLNERMQTIVGE